MNAAAKALTQSTRGRGLVMTRDGFWALFWLICALASAISVIYVKNAQRCLAAELQTLQNRHNQMEVEWGQLVLEHGALTAPARLEHIAAANFHLKLPGPHDIVMVEQ